MGLVEMESQTVLTPHFQRSQFEFDPIRLAWENVVLKGLPPGQDVKPEILRSWQYCLRIRLNPFDNASAVCSRAQLSSFQELNKNLLEIAKPTIEMIETAVRGTGFIVTLTEKNGYVLLFCGKEDILQISEQNYFLPGCIVTCEHAGTNAIGICLFEKKPVQVTGAEHYKEAFHLWICSSAPIFDGHGELIGVISLSGKFISKHKHTLALAVAAAEIIQMQLREKQLKDEKNRINYILTSFFNSTSDGVIAIDSNSIITHVNRSALEMLEMRADFVLGRKLNDLLNSEGTLPETFKVKKYLNNNRANFIIVGGEKICLSRVDPILNSTGQILGSIITMTKKRKIIAMAEKIGGNHTIYEFDSIIGENPEFRKKVQLAKVAAKTNSRILLIGETGTGKELFAQAIHHHSDRKNGPFVAISCAVIPRDLIESELFGYVGGTFTGASPKGMIGKFELANNGTLFLDEINSMPLELQSKLVRVLQQNEIMRIGATHPTRINVRVIAASNVDLLSEVENKNFREDLYYRLSVIEIRIPPLRDRLDDVELLISHSLDQLCKAMGIEKPKVSGEVLRILRNYTWPGNIRELENCLERTLVLSQGKTIDITNIPESIVTRTNIHNFSATTLNEAVTKIIQSTISRCGGNISKAAKELRIARSTLYRKIKEFGLR